MAYNVEIGGVVYRWNSEEELENRIRFIQNMERGRIVIHSDLSVTRLNTFQFICWKILGWLAPCLRPKIFRAASPTHLQVLFQRLPTEIRARYVHAFDPFLAGLSRRRPPRERGVQERELRAAGGHPMGIEMVSSGVARFGTRPRVAPRDVRSAHQEVGSRATFPPGGIAFDIRVNPDGGRHMSPTRDARLPHQGVPSRGALAPRDLSGQARVIPGAGRRMDAPRTARVAPPGVPARRAVHGDISSQARVIPGSGRR